LVSSGASPSRWSEWIPTEEHTGQSDECTRAKAVYNRLAKELSDEEICIRTFRELELRRVGVEVRRAAIALTLGELAADGTPVAPAEDTVVDQWFVDTIAALNLMGIDTLLPGEASADRDWPAPGNACIYLVSTLTDGSSGQHNEQLDALGGLISEFHKSDIILNGLQIVLHVEGNEQRYALVAAHPAIMSSFAEFLAHKYLSEGWRLE
jgi:hypothetical protein